MNPHQRNPQSSQLTPQSTTKRRCRTPLAGSALLLALLACNVPVGVEPTIPAPSGVPPTPTIYVPPDTAPTHGATSEPPASDIPPPTATPEPADPLAILDGYDSLVTVRQRLDGMVATHRESQVTATGRELLVSILLDQQYDPTADNPAKEQVFATLNAYDFPHPGARIYLVNVATGLFAEAHRLYPWSLQDYSAQQIDDLFIEDDTPSYPPDPALHHGDLPAGMPNVASHWYPVPDKVVEDAHYKQFNLARRLTQEASTQEEAVAQIVVWMQQNFFHAQHPGYGWEVYLDGREPRSSGPVAYPQSIERIYEERVCGCHEPTILLEGMLHALNIPAVPIMVHGHGVLYLPTLDRYVHGDHVVAYTDAPPGMLLLTPQEFRPFAEDEGWIYAIVYPDKYVTPFRSMPLWRDGDHLYIHIDNVRLYPDPNCIQVSDEEWTRISQQLAIYNLHYDDENCELTSDEVPILTLDELNDLDS